MCQLRSVTNLIPSTATSPGPRRVINPSLCKHEASGIQVCGTSLVQGRVPSPSLHREAGQFSWEKLGPSLDER